MVRLGAQRGVPNLLSNHDQVVVANVKHFGETGINLKLAQPSETLKTITGRSKMRPRGHRGVVEKILHNIFSSTALFAKMRQFAARYGENESPIFGKTRILEGVPPHANRRTEDTFSQTDPAPRRGFPSRVALTAGLCPLTPINFRYF